jgi:hypothetical protein
MKGSSISSAVWGILLILAGATWLGTNLLNVNIDFTLLWPIFLLIPGAILWLTYLFSKNQSNHAVLIPANILVFLSITFFFNMFASVVLHYDRAWLLTVSMYSTGPVAIAFWITWAASGRLTRYLVPAVIMTIISACIAFITVPLALFNTPIFTELSKVGFPLLMILIGLLIIFSPIWTKAFEQSNEVPNPQPTPNLEVEEAEIVETKPEPTVEAKVEEPGLQNAQKLDDEG